MMERNKILLSGKKIIKSLMLSSALVVSVQADFLMSITDKNGVEENLCVKSYSFSNNLESLHKEVNQKDVYSTEETLTNKTWIDGKPIYRKVAKMPSLIASNTWRWTYYDNPPKDVERLITAELMMRDLSAYGSSSTTHSLRYEVRTDRIGYLIGTSIGGNFINPYVLLEYTKTTDNAQIKTNELTTLVHYLPSKSKDGEYITKSTKNLKIGFFENYTYDASTNSCIAPAN